MGVLSIQVTARAWRRGGQNLAKSEIKSIFTLAPPGGFAPTVRYPKKPWQAATIILLADEIHAHEAAEEPTEQFAAAIQAQLERAALWLAAQSAERIRAARDQGVDVDVFAGMWIDDDQLDLTLPPSLLLECGRLGLPITICSND
ncbi:MAG TPA: hypothetical protein VGE07_29060 [Herpetosiphonaceae bacterium]